LAEVFALENGRVVKLDRPGWSGVSVFESGVISRAAEAGLPVARSHGVITIDGRCGVVLDRIEGDSLQWVLARASDAGVDDMAEQFAALQSAINATTIEGLPDLVIRLHGEIERSNLPGSLASELDGLLTTLDDGLRGVCHFDLHPHNVLVSPNGWVVIDWLTAASGPPVADLARTLLLRGDIRDSPIVDFMRGVRRHSQEQRSLDDDTCDAWIRITAAARLAEGFDGEYAAWLRGVAGGSVRLCA
jgi:hypothetical protein